MSNYFLPSASTKTNLMNADANDPRDVISKLKSEEQFQLINIVGNGPYSSEEVSGFIHFKMYKYLRGRQERKFFSDNPILEAGRAIQDGAFFRRERNDKTDYKGLVILPLMSQVQMGYGVNWSNFQSPLRDAMNAMGLTPRSLAQEGIAKYQSMLGERSSATNTSSPNREKASEGAMMGSQQLDNQMANEAGLIFNPDDELVLEGIDLRTHSFEFLITPRNKEENEAVLKAIQLFKIAALPSKKFNLTANSAAGLEYPYEFSIYFMDSRLQDPQGLKTDIEYRDDLEQKWEERVGLAGKGFGVLEIPIIPDSALVDIQVVYNPIMSRFHVDGTPIQYRITLVFREHQTLTADDIIEGGF